jgi:hypothetical protein
MSVTLGDLEIDVGEGTVTLCLDDVIPISEDISQEFTDQPSLYAYIAILAAQAEACWRESKRSTEEETAQLDKNVRQDLMANGEKITEGKVAAEVKLRRGYRDAVDYEMECHEQYLIMRAVENAMSQRAQMLISLGAHLRAEAAQTGMIIKDTKDKLDQYRASRRK